MKNWLDKFQKGGTKPPIYTTDKSKVDVYKDSLNLYNNAIGKLKYWKENPNATNVELNQEEHRLDKLFPYNPFTRPFIKPYDNTYKFSDYTYIGTGNAKRRVPLYTKPTQPYILGREQEQLNYLPFNNMQEQPGQGMYPTPELLRGFQMVPYTRGTVQYPGGYQEKGYELVDKVYKDGGSPRLINIMDGYMPKKAVDNTATPLTPRTADLSQNQLYALRTEGLRKREEEKKEIESRKQAEKIINSGKGKFTLPTGETKDYSKMNFREKSYVKGEALKNRGRFFPDENNIIDDLNPLNWIGSMAGNMSQAPYVAQQTDSYMPYATAIAEPLLMGRAIGSGSINPFGKKFWTNSVSDAEFANSLLMGVPKAGVKVLSKLPFENVSILNQASKINPRFRNIELNPVGIFKDYSSGLLKGAGEQLTGLMKDLRISSGNASRRPFFETFPITKTQKAKVSAMQDEALNDAIEFTKNYWYADNSENIRPVLEDKIRAFVPDIKMARTSNNLERTNPKNPFNTTEDLLVKNTTGKLEKEGLDEEIINYLNKNRGQIGGVNDGNKSITLRNSGFYYKTPKRIGEIVVHEGGHTAQRFGPIADFKQNTNFAVDQPWSSVITKDSPKYEYYTSNTDTELGRRFQKALVDPKEKNARQTWLSSPDELHSEMMAGKYNLYKQGLKQGYSAEEMMSKVTNPSEKELLWILDNKKLNKHFKPETSLKEKLSLMKLLPAAIPVVAGTSALQEKKKGGIIEDPMGQWKYPGQITRIPSSNITMQGVNYPVYGVDNNGQEQMMYPGQEYNFPGADYVDEYPMMKDGGLLSKSVTCSNCGWSWKSVEGGLDPLTCHKCGGMIKMKSGGQHGGLDRWFAEKWVDVKTGKECGRQEGENREGYPACRPSKRINADTPKTVSELSAAEKAKFKQEKTSSERINYNHKKQMGGDIPYNTMENFYEMKEGGNVPTNPSLWSKAKSVAKSKYDVYPSAYANGFAAKWYKERGGNWKKAEYGMEVMKNGGTNNPGFQALPEFVQAKILSNMGYGGYYNPMMANGGEPDGEMALGQIDAAINKLTNLRKFIQPDSDLEPWVSSKLTMVDDYANSVSDYMMYNPETQEMMELPLEEMKNGGIPERYKKMGFTKVGTKKQSTRPGKKWMVLAKKGDDYKVVHGGYKGMQDFKQHHSEQRRKNFWNRMGGKNSSKATDPFSPLYWHKRFGTWENGGQINQMQNGGIMMRDLQYPVYGMDRDLFNSRLQNGGNVNWLDNIN